MKIRPHGLFFEADPGDAGGGGGGSPAPPADPAAGVADPGTPAADAWAPPQEEWRSVQQFIEQAGPTLGLLNEVLADPGYGQGEQGAAPPQLDLSNPQSVQSYLDSQVDRMFQERMAPFQPLLGQIAEREGETAARSRLDELAGTVGNFDRDQALIAAQVLLGQGLAPDQALERAARRQFEFENTMRAAAVKDYTDKLAAAALAPGSAPGGMGAGHEAPGVPKGRDRYEVALQNGLARMNPISPESLLQ